MLAGIKQLFRGIRLEPISLSFEMDMDDSGKHVVRVYRQTGDTRRVVDDIQSLWAYGYREQAEDGHVSRSIRGEDRQVLYSLRSLNPTVREDGALVFDITPPVLRYLRGKRVTESNNSLQLRVSEKPARPAARIDFNPVTGLEVETGYAVEDATEIIPAGQIEKTVDGGYIRVGNTFAPLPKDISAKAQLLLEKPTHRVAVDDIPEFFQRDLVIIKKEFNAVLTDLAQQIRVITDPLALVVRVNDNQQGWLDFQIEYDASGLSVPHAVLLKSANQDYHRLDPRTWIAIDPKVVAKTQKKIEELNAIPTVDGYRLPVSQYASLEEFIKDIGGRSEVSVAYREFLARLTGFEASDTYRLPDPIERHLEVEKINLRPYQRSGIHWLQWLYSNHLHGVLADDMGLGKTIEMLCAMRLAYEESKVDQHSLVVAPKSVLPHWEREIHRCFPDIGRYGYHGPNRQSSLLRSNQPIIFITTYATLSSDIDLLVEIPFFYLILDEATQIKNPSAHRTQAVKALNAAHRVALSGTPVENRPAELWSLFDFLMRGHLGRYGTFAGLFENSIMQGDRHASEKLGHRIHPFLLRRKKEDVAKDLPEKIEIKEWCDLTQEQRQLYGSLQDEAKRIRESLERGENINYATNILPVLTKLKQICDHPALVTKQPQPLGGRSEKFDWIIEKVVEINQKTEQVLVFSHFLEMLNLLEAALRERGIAYIRIDGSTDNRQILIDSFNQQRIPVALLSLQAAGHGINLTAANHVIHADRWWNPAIEDQATDRVHRIGQERTVYVYRILTEGTLEERIDKLLEEKREIANQIISSAGEAGGRWTKEEIMELLRPLD